MGVITAALVLLLVIALFVIFGNFIFRLLPLLVVVLIIWFMYQYIKKEY